MAQEGFLGRWARLKRDADVTDRTGDAGEAAGAVPALQPGTAPPEGGGAEAPAAAGASIVMRGEAAAVETGRESGAVVDPAGGTPMKLPSIDTLTLDSDYSMFMQKDVDPHLRVGALKKLFSDPHFNQMDGLDVYIDDYSKPDPVPSAFLKRLNQARILGLAEEEKDVADAPAESFTTPAAAPVAAAGPDSPPAGIPADGDDGEGDAPAMPAAPPGRVA